MGISFCDVAGVRAAALPEGRDFLVAIHCLHGAGNLAAKKGPHKRDQELRLSPSRSRVNLNGVIVKT
jgi:hypothetical protein